VVAIEFPKKTLRVSKLVSNSTLHFIIVFHAGLIGFPNGPVTIAGQQFFADAIVGCAIPAQVRLRYPDGRTEIIEEGCQKAITFADLANRRTSKGILFGDFGNSQVILRDRPISILINSRLPYTLTLMGATILISLLIGVPLGIYSAVRQYSRFDYAMTTVSFVGSSLPTFVIGIIMYIGICNCCQRSRFLLFTPWKCGCQLVTTKFLFSAKWSQNQHSTGYCTSSCHVACWSL